MFLLFWIVLSIDIHCDFFIEPILCYVYMFVSELILQRFKSPSNYDRYGRNVSIYYIVIIIITSMQGNMICLLFLMKRL